MKIRNKKIITCLLIMTFSLGLIYGGSKSRRGTAGAQELLIPSGARGTAMSGAFVSGISGIEAIDWNPAGLGSIKGNGEAVLSMNQWLADITINHGAIGFKMGRNIFGLSLRAMDFGDIPITTAELTDGTGEYYSPSYFTLGTNFARKMTDRIYFGVGIKLVNESLMNVSASGFAFDAGVQYRSVEDGFSLGASLRNLGMNMLFNGTDFEEFHQPDGTIPGAPSEPRRIVIQGFELPTTFELGASYGPLNIGPLEGTFSASFLNNNFSFDEIRVGSEFSFLNMVYFRGGFAIGLDPEPYGPDGIKNTDDDDDNSYDYNSEEFIWGPSFGFGLDLAKLINAGITVDYSYRTAEYFDGVNWISIKILF
ncbi:MAG: PorV/PorQ family protein [Candidatus Marinimicrobia bacterium]|nr:PorV/PorQ family protein [Candidatus Neomarinimicrobiota bacterium]